MGDITTYSVKVPGDARNHQLPVVFDDTDGYIGITQDGGRVLLSPEQVKALLRFLKAPKSRRYISDKRIAV